MEYNQKYDTIIDRLVETAKKSPINSHKLAAVIVSGKKLSSVLDMLGLDYVDFIKCDIEGSEMIAINDQTIEETKDRVGAWFIETHNTSTGNTHDNRNKLKEVFEKAGYQTEYYEADGLRVFKS